MRSRPTVLILGAVASLLIFSACSSVKATKAKSGRADERNEVSVQVFTVKPRGIRRAVEAVGSLFAYDEVVVSSEVDGRAEKVLVDVGDHVTQGQTLVEIVPTEFKLAAAQQEAMLEQARAKLGSTDGEGEIKDPTQRAAVKKAAADLANAKQKYERSKALAEQGLVPRQNFEEDESNYKAVQATYELAVQDVRNLQASVTQGRVMRDLANKKLRDTNILAPFGGFVKERNVTVGQYLKVQTPVMTIVNVDPMRVRLKVPEKMAAWVPVGQMVTLSVEAYPDRTFSGRVSRINPSVDPQTRTFDAEALIDNHPGVLKPGFFVKASIPSTRTDQVFFVPQKALSYAYGIYKVYAITEQNTLKEREVKLGDRLDQDAEVIEGVKEGDRLAVPIEGQELAMKDGATIKVVSVAGKSKPPTGSDPGDGKYPGDGK